MKLRPVYTLLSAVILMSGFLGGAVKAANATSAASSTVASSGAYSGS